MRAQDNSIPTPKHIIVDRDSLPPGAVDPPGFKEADDWVEADAVRIYKPFVEKPTDGEVQWALRVWGALRVWALVGVDVGASGLRAWALRVWM